MLIQLIGVLVTFASAGTPVTPQLPSFSIVVATSGTRGIAATCETGCAWKTVTGEYAGGAYAVSTDGIRPAPTPADTAFVEHAQRSGFSIVVTPTDGGVRLTCTYGCAWITLTGDHSSGTYRITESGIQLVVPAVPGPARD